MTRIMMGAVAVTIAIGLQTVSASDGDRCTKRAAPNAAIEACTKVIQGKPEPSVEIRARLVRARAYARKGMNLEAVSDFTEVLRRVPQNNEALLGRAECHLAARDFVRAQADYSVLVARAPAHTIALIGRGYVRLATGQPERAIEDFSKALEHDPRNGIALNNRGLAFKKLGRLDLAIRDFTSAIDFNPLYALVYNNRAYAYEAKGDAERAIRDFRSALTIDPSLTAARNGLERLKAAGSIVAAVNQRVADGRKVAEKNCAWCHSIGSSDRSPNPQAPPFREIHARHPILALRMPIARAIATPHDRMPKLPLSVNEVDKIVAYINSMEAQK